MHIPGERIVVVSKATRDNGCMADEHRAAVSRISWGRWLMAALFLVAGAMHFVFPAAYVRIVPPYLPYPAALVAISGVAEMLGGIGLLVERTRRAAAIGLALLLVAVLPANWWMAASHMRIGNPPVPEWVLWARLPLQVPLIWWALVYSRSKGSNSHADSYL
jgi:uncharacterized membrane protein